MPIIGGITEAKARWASLIRQAESGEEIIVTRRGAPAAMLYPIHAAQLKRPSSRGPIHAAQFTRPIQHSEIRDIRTHLVSVDSCATKS